MSEFYPHLTDPPKGVEAFARISEEASPSQAAVLLLLGQQLEAPVAPAVRNRPAWQTQYLQQAGLGDESEFPVPRLRGARTSAGVLAVSARLKKTYGFTRAKAASWESLERSVQDSAERCFQRGRMEDAYDLLQMCLDHPKTLVKVAAATAYWTVTSRRERCLQILTAALTSPDALERDVAATALARLRPSHPGLKSLLRRPKSHGAGAAAHTLILVHGTWASDAEWYKPGGSFWSYVNSFRPDLYGAPDFFFWSGGYSDAARESGAVKLKAWVNNHGAAGLDAMGHSHGANVMLLATQKGLVLGKLVLLSCPVHQRYLPVIANLNAPVHSVRVRLDLVILADGGGQRFSHPDIQEHVLPIWFDHSATHDQNVWTAHGVQAQVGM